MSLTKELELDALQTRIELFIKKSPPQSNILFLDETVYLFFLKKCKQVIEQGKGQVRFSGFLSDHFHLATHLIKMLINCFSSLLQCTLDMDYHLNAYFRYFHSGCYWKKNNQITTE
jgi:hypothetical protein